MSCERFTSESQTCLDPFRLAWSSASSLLRPVCSCFVHFPIPFRLVCSCFSDSFFSNPTVSSERFTSLKHFLAPFAWPGPLSRVCFGRFALAFPISLSTGLILFLKRPSSSNPHSVFRVVCLCVSNIPWPLSTGLVLFLESASAGVLLFLSTFPFPFDWFAPVLLSQIPQWLSSGVLLSLKYFLSPFD